MLQKFLPVVVIACDTLDGRSWHSSKSQPTKKDNSSSLSGGDGLSIKSRNMSVFSIRGKNNINTISINKSQYIANSKK